ncbi:MAG: signal peptide peptidase SppA [Flavobacteriaceae bacterium]|nr:signal peptide peptidase SppA [Flavobacteriaceae bacterium]
MKRFFAAFLGALAAVWFFFIIGFLLVVGMSQLDTAPTVSDKTVLTVKLNRPLLDYQGSTKDDLFSAFFQEYIALDEIVEAIDAASTDDRIKGISIESPVIIGGWAQTAAIRDAIERFKTSGKFVYAYADTYTQRAYYLASVADSVFVTPAGAIDLRGLASELTYYKSFQEKSGLKMEVIRHGKYKAAVEPYLEDAPTEQNLEQVKRLLNTLWLGVSEAIGISRQLDESQLDQVVSTAVSRDPEKALDHKIIDRIGYKDQYEEALKRALKTDANPVSAASKLNQLSVSAYARTLGVKTTETKDRIALVYAQGTILYGEGSPTVMGQTTMNRALIAAREDKTVKAVVLRINSPGGSALTSDLIWREVKKTAAEKPVVVSISDIAASGGYYIATPATYIIADRMAITGSIGVFGTLPNASALAKEWGINSYSVGTHERSVTYSLLQPLSESFRAELQDGVERTYDLFIERVAEGRSMTADQVDAIAQGRVWGAQDALEIGLIDEIGGIETAFEKAAALADIQAYKVRKYPRFKSDFERLFSDLPNALVQRWFAENTPSWAQRYKLFWDKRSSIDTDAYEVQARMPYELIID